MESKDKNKKHQDGETNHPPFDWDDDRDEHDWGWRRRIQNIQRKVRDEKNQERKRD